MLAGLAAERDATSRRSSASPPSTAATASTRAREKLERKGLDAIVVNDVSRAEIGFDRAENEVMIVEADGEHAVPLASKHEVADAILDRVEALARGAEHV